MLAKEPHSTTLGEGSIYLKYRSGATLPGDRTFLIRSNYDAQRDYSAG